MRPECLLGFARCTDRREGFAVHRVSRLRCGHMKLWRSRRSTILAMMSVALVAATPAIADELPIEAGPTLFRFHAPVGFVDAQSRHGQDLEPRWRLFCGDEGIAACAFSGEYEDDGSRAFAYAKLVPGAQPIGEALLAKLQRSLETGFDARDATVHVEERSLDKVDGHTAGRLLATVTASGRTTKRWVWVVSTREAMAMLTFVSPAESFEHWRSAFEASARSTEGTIEAPPLLLQLLGRGKRTKALQAGLWILLLILVVKVVAQASTRRRQMPPRS